MGEKGLVVQRSEDDGCHSEPEQRGGEESRRTEDCTRDSSACGLRMTDPQNQCDETLVLCQYDFDTSITIMPAQAGIQKPHPFALDSRFRGHDAAPIPRFSLSPFPTLHPFVHKHFLGQLKGVHRRRHPGIESDVDENLDDLLLR